MALALFVMFLSEVSLGFVDGRHIASHQVRDRFSRTIRRLIGLNPVIVFGNELLISSLTQIRGGGFFRRLVSLFVLLLQKRKHPGKFKLFHHTKP